MDPYIACLHRLDIALDRDGWDQDPGLYRLHQPAPGARVTATKLPIPTSTWYATGPRHGPARALLDFASRSTAVTAFTTGDPQDVGWLFVCEAWLLEGKGEAGRNRMRKIQRQRAIDLAPDRTEIRALTMCTFTGRFLSLRHRRDTGVVDVEEAGVASGSIRSALAHLCGIETPVPVRL